MIGRSYNGKVYKEIVSISNGNVLSINSDRGVSIMKILYTMLRGLRKTAVYLWFAVILEYILTRVMVFVTYQSGNGDELTGFYKDEWFFDHFSWAIVGIILYNTIDFSIRIIVYKEYKASNFIWLALNAGIVLFGIFS
jgi:hypothetical protein